jgi:transcriptional regulator with XRE-family HTH domain
LRVERGLSQAALAGREISAGYLSRLESGARPPTSRVLELLGERLDVPLSAFEESVGDRAVSRTASSLSQILAAVISSADPGELGETLNDALTTQDQWDPALRWQALWLLAEIRRDERRLEDEELILRELNDLSEVLGAPVLLARARSRLSRWTGVLGDKASALALALDARAVADGLSAGDKAEVLQVLIAAETESGLLREGRAHSDELLALVEPLGGPPLVKALWTAATVRIRQGDHGEAQRMLDRALELDTGLDVLLWLRLRLAAASLHLQLVPPSIEIAKARLNEVTPLVDVLNAEVHRQQLLTLRSYVAFAEGRFDEAWSICASMDDEALQLSFHDLVRFRSLRGQLLIVDGRRAEGISVLQELAQQAQDAHNIELVAEIWRILARTLAEHPEPTVR